MVTLQKNTISTAFVFIFISIFSYSYVIRENPIYMWDYGAYYSFYINISNIDNFFKKTEYLFSSIKNDDYNYFLAYIISPFYMLYEKSRYGYILSILLVYYCPVFFICNNIINKYNFALLKGNLKYFIFLFILLYTPFWAPTLRGMPDIAGLIFLALAWIILLKTNYLTLANLKNVISFGLLLWLMFLCRRWYLYTVVLMFLLPCIYANLIILKDKNYLKNFIIVNIFYLLSFVIFISLFYFLQKNLFIRIINTNYSQLYVAYSLSLSDSLWFIFNSIGKINSLLFLIGILFAIFDKNKNVVFCGIFCITLIFWFLQTQSMGLHHLLPVAFFAIFPIVYAISKIAYSVPKIHIYVFLIMISFFSIINFFHTFNLGYMPSFYVVNKLYTNPVIPPLKVQNFDEYVKLIQYLNSITDKEHKVAVFGSGVDFNDSFLLAIDNGLSNEVVTPLSKVMINSSQVDERDGLYLPPIAATYAVVADPIPFHLAKEHQRVVSYVAKSLLSGTGLGEDYDKLPIHFNIANGRTVYIFKRKSPLDNVTIKKIETDLQEFYPNWIYNGNDRIYKK